MSAEVEPCVTAVDVVVAGPGVVVGVSAPNPQISVGAPAVIVVVETGVQGATGQPGASGVDGARGTFEYQQSQLSDTWRIAHNLNRHPSVTIVDTGGNQIDTAVSYVDANNVLVEFTAPTCGAAYLN